MICQWYLWASVDQNGERLNSAGKYELYIRKDQFPKVEAFWSFTMYQDFNLVVNEINRWAKRVLWLGLGLGRQNVRPFFELLGPTGRASMQAVAMNINEGYAQEVSAQCPAAKIVYDLFHVVAKYGRHVTNRVRADEANQLHHDNPARELVKTSRGLRASNPENITRPEDQVQLRELLANNRALFVV